MDTHLSSTSAGARGRAAGDHALPACMRLFSRLRLLPVEERPLPTASLRASGVVPLVKLPPKKGDRGVRAGALFLPSDDGQPPPKFTTIWRAPISQVRAASHRLSVHT